MPEEISRYQKIALLGKGGMGEVWEAVDQRTGRTVALKILTSEALLFPDLRERFLREMRLAAEIENPYVVAVYDFAIGPPPFIAMRLIRGRSLATEIQHSAGGLPPARAVDIVQQVASALAAAHDSGLRHRDVKPSNILLDQGHRQGLDHAYLIDWGIAHRIDTSDPEITRVGQIVGTPSYIAPERLLGTQSDHRADIYSLAVVLYQALTGKLPFGETGKSFPLQAHLFEPPKPLPPSVSPALRDVVMRGLAKEPGDRYSSAGEFGHDAYTALHPVAARQRPASSARQGGSRPSGSRPSGSRPGGRKNAWPIAGAGAGAVAGAALALGGLLDAAATLWALPALAAAGACLAWGLRPSSRPGDSA
ncbi:serine/threonine-protein kinase [Actinoplanes sp. NPDC051861]|uniref:serine/threonine-protein kinase n=1 Tax=Actinoplanes sp. NPDC051861 TaxID=3155170 RepID=UPI0034180E9E